MLYLLQDGVFTARKRFEAGEKLIAEISLRQRGITKERLSGAVRVSNMDEPVDLTLGA